MQRKASIQIMKARTIYVNLTTIVNFQKNQIYKNYYNYRIILGFTIQFYIINNYCRDYLHLNLV